MEQSSAQNPMPGLPHGATTQGSLPPEYWNGLDSIYAGDPQFPQSSQQPQGPPSQQTPLGIGWDHPVFQQQQRDQVTPQPEQNHGIYSVPQSWQPNPLHQPPQRYGVPSQYQTPSQVPQFQQSQMNFDSRPLTPSETSPFPAYSYQPNSFHPQQLSVQDTFPEPFGQQNVPSQPQQPVEYQPASSQSSISQYPIPPSYPPGLLQNTIDLTNDYPEAEPGVPHHQTINPQYLDSAPQNSTEQHPSLSNNFLYGIPAGFDRPDNGKMFDYYQHNLSVQPQIAQAVGAVVPSLGANATRITEFPQPQVVMPTGKKATTKKPTQTKKAGTKAPRKAQAQSDSDSSEDSDLEIEAPDEPSPIPATRPTEPAAAAEFDTLHAVWSPRNKRPSVEKVKNALVAFKDVIKALRDSWKEQVQAMKLAENQGNNDKATQLKQNVALQRHIMDKIVTTALAMGHPRIVEKLGEHPMALAAIYSFLADRFQAADFEAALTMNILKLLARFSTVDEELLQKTNIAKLLPKFMKKGGQPVKDLAQKILDNAVASTKRKQSNGKSNGSPMPAESGPVDSKGEVAGSKRPREGEGNQPATKRMVVAGAKDTNKPSSNGPAKRLADGAQNGKATGATAPRPKANIIAPKPTSLFGSLSSASKRPGTTNAERAAAAASKPTPAEKKEKAAPPPKPAFSFGDIMADLNKPKEPVSTEPAEDQPPETEEERQKRLRKEERRKLRVSWKPDDSLTEVRLFTHDPDEELGPGDGSLRGAGDVKGEGSVLKLHKDLDELEEDDLGGIRETSLRDYQDLSEIAFEAEYLKGANFIKRGGTQQPTSPEKEAQDHRESTTLMVFYSSPADVPPSPKEPPAPDPDEVVPDEVPFGELPDDLKARQERYFSMVNPIPPAPPQPNPTSNGFDISNLLKIIQGAPGQQQQQQQPVAPPQAPQHPPTSDLERTISMFRQHQTQAPAPPIPQMPVSQPPSQPPAGQGVDFQGILNVMMQMQQAPGMLQPQQSQPAMPPNLGAMFSQFMPQNQQGASQQGFDYEDPERKRMRESAYNDDKFEGSWSRQKRTKANDPKPYKVGLVACKFWAEGKCRKGDNCTFRHDT